MFGGRLDGTAQTVAARGGYRPIYAVLIKHDGKRKEKNQADYRPQNCGIENAGLGPRDQNRIEKAHLVALKSGESEKGVCGVFEKIRIETGPGPVNNPIEAAARSGEKKRIGGAYTAKKENEKSGTDLACVSICRAV